MGYKSKTSITQTVALSNGYEAVIRLFRAGDEDAIQAALLGANTVAAHVESGVGGQTTTKQDLSFDSAAHKRETLLRGIVSWTLDDDNGAILPINAATLGDLTGADANTLFLAITELNKALDDEAKKG